MPSYPERGRELRQRLDDARLSPIERVRITAVIDEVMTIRDAALTMIVTMMADTGKDALTKDYTDALVRFRSQMDAKWNDILSGLPLPSNAAELFRERVLVEEAGFWGAPGIIFAAEARDDLVARATVLRQMTEALDRKWAAFTEEDLRVERAEAEAAEKVRDILNRAIHQQVDLQSRLGNEASEMLQKLSKIDDRINEWYVAIATGAGMPRALAEYTAKLSNLFQQGFDKAKELGIPAAEFAAALASMLVTDPGFRAVEWFKAAFGADIRQLFTVYSEIKKALQYQLQESYVQQTSAWRALMPVQSAILVTFTSTRTDVDRFLQANNLDVGRRKMEWALTDIDRWRDGVMTDGQRAAATPVRDAMRDALLGRMAALATEWNAMFGRHDGRFMGPLSSQTEKDLLNTDQWIVTMNGMVQIGMDEKLREWRRTTTEIPVRIGDSFARVERAFEHLPAEMRDRIRGPINSYLGQTLRELNSEAESTARALDECALMVNARKFEQDMNRGQLRDRLRN
jgi:hypothetical protein